jgi:hypothetical protein
MTYEMLVGFAPFTGYSAPNLLQNVKKGDWKIPKNINISLPCLDFLNKCL